MSSRYKIFTKYCFLLLLFLSLGVSSAVAQTRATTFKGVVKDSVTLEPLPQVAIAFDNTNIGAFSDEKGEFKISNWGNRTKVTITYMGYRPRTLTIPAGKISDIEILLQNDGVTLNEVVVKPKKEKYSKKNNPAVELIKKVIANKRQNFFTDQDYYQCKEYERILFALNDFKPDQFQFKHFKFLPNYIDTSLIDSKLILPFSIRETTRDYYYRKKPKTERRVIDGYQITGIDQSMETEGMDAVITEVFKNINIYDNSIILFLNDFTSPLSDNGAVNFYRWYIQDTITMDDNKRYIDLAFIPFNTRDIGFTGNLYISTDSTFAVKKAILRAPRKMNINFVDELVIVHEFEQLGSRMWVPKEQHMAVDMSLVKAAKFYVDKAVVFENYQFTEASDSIFNQPAPIIYAQDYAERDKQFWQLNRPEAYAKDYKMDNLVADIRSMSFFRFLLNAANILSAGYVHTSKDPKKNKFDLGTANTFFSYNPVEGARFRLTGTTTKNFHPHLYLYGYGAYGLKDHKMKYYGEATWAFGNVRDHKDQFPKNNLIVGYKYDLNNLGQRYTQSERDDIWMSLRRSSDDKTTYNKQFLISYIREFYNGFSFNVLGQTSKEEHAGKLSFEKYATDSTRYTFNDVKTTELGLALRFAPNEKFVQQRRRRYTIPYEEFIISLSHTQALKGVLGGHFDYGKTSFSITKEFWFGSFGKLNLTAQAEKVWGETFYPMLVTPSANNSYTIQNGSFALLKSLEFIHDSQVSWAASYRMGGWLFNRIPLLNLLKIREVFGIKGFVGELSKKNNPLYNHDLLLFPEQTFTTNRGAYWEFNVGVENILQFFRIDYVRRLSYLDHPGVDKSTFLITFDMRF